MARVACPRLGGDMRVPRSPGRGEVSARRETPLSTPSGGHATRCDRLNELNGTSVPECYTVSVFVSPDLFCPVLSNAARPIVRGRVMSGKT
ncbi:MAG: hypothetical protein JWO38_5040, partial [Gemmataceae bacterium]|nr:hypothetical protein [Gemmataceae bacterium]